MNTALVLTGTHFSLDNRVKFVKSSTSCSEGVSTNPIQMNTVSVDGTSATLMTVEFPEAGEYYLCIVHHVASNQYVHYDHKITVVETAIDVVRNDPVLFVLSEDPISDSITVEQDFLSYVATSDSICGVDGVYLR